MQYVINNLPTFCKNSDPNGRIHSITKRNMLPIKIIPGRLKIAFLDYVLEQGVFDPEGEGDDDKKVKKAEDISKALNGDKNDLFTFSREMVDYAKTVRTLIFTMGQNIGFSNGELTQYISEIGFADLFTNLASWEGKSKGQAMTENEKNNMESAKESPTSTLLKGADFLKNIFVSSLIGYVDVSSEGEYSFTSSYKDSILLSSLDEVMAGSFFSGILGNIAEGTKEITNYASASSLKRYDKDKDSITGKAMNALKTVAGSKILIPKVWENSTASSSINLTFKLKAPFGDRFTVFSTVLVPFVLLLALALPKQSIKLGYSMPFVLAIDAPSVIQSAACVVTSFTYTRGGDSNLYSIDGLPLEMSVQLAIEDVFDSMFLPDISKNSDRLSKALNSNPLFYSFLNNISGYSPSAGSVSTKVARYFENGIFNLFNNAISFVENSFEQAKDESIISKIADFFK